MSTPNELSGEGARRDAQRGEAFAVGQELCQCGRAQHSLSFLKRYRMLFEGRNSKHFVFMVFSLYLFISFSLTDTIFNCIYHKLARALHSSKSFSIVHYLFYHQLTCYLLRNMHIYYQLRSSTTAPRDITSQLISGTTNCCFLIAEEIFTLNQFFSIGINFWYTTSTCVLGTRKIIYMWKLSGCSNIA